MALTRKKVILFELEAIPGTEETPTGAANAIEVRNLTITPLQGDAVSHELLKPFLGGSPESLVGEHAIVEFEVNIAGSGTAGVAPAWGPVIQACGFSETVTADTDVQYAPVSDSLPSATIYAHADGKLHKLTFARGTVQGDLTAKGIPFFRFRFLGKHHEATDTALPTAVYTAFKKPMPVNKTNTPTFEFFGISSLALESFRFDINNSLVWRSLVNAEYSMISDRKATAEIVYESVAMSVLNIFKKAKDNDTGVINLVHGTAAGNIVEFDAPIFDPGMPIYGESDGVEMINCPGNLVPSAGNDEFTITVR